MNGGPFDDARLHEIHKYQSRHWHWMRIVFACGRGNKKRVLRKKALKREWPVTCRQKQFIHICGNMEPYRLVHGLAGAQHNVSFGRPARQIEIGDNVDVNRLPSFMPGLNRHCWSASITFGL